MIENIRQRGFYCRKVLTNGTILHVVVKEIENGIEIYEYDCYRNSTSEIFPEMTIGDAIEKYSNLGYRYIENLAKYKVSMELQHESKLTELCTELYNRDEWDRNLLIAICTEIGVEAKEDASNEKIASWLTKTYGLDIAHWKKF